MELKHSGLGISAFVCSIVGGIGMFALFVGAGALAAGSPGGVIDEKAATTVILGALIIAAIFLNLVALGLGIGGLFQKDRKKVFAILGSIFSSVTILGTIGMLILGFALA